MAEGDNDTEPTHESFYRVLELRTNPIQGKFDTAHLKQIHAHIFQDSPEFGPGAYRKPLLDMPLYFKNRGLEDGARHRVHYMPHDFANRVDAVLKDFGGPDALRGLPHEQAVEKLAKLYGDLDHAHPFAEGNSRTLREFTRSMAKEAGFTLDWGTTNVNAQQRNELYIARDVAVTQRAFPGLNREKASNGTRAEFETYLGLLAPNADKPTLAQVIAKNLTPDRQQSLGLQDAGSIRKNDERPGISQANPIHGSLSPYAAGKQATAKPNEPAKTVQAVQAAEPKGGRGR